MQPYQSYYPAQMPMYQNSYNQQMQQLNPYMDRLSQLQNLQQTQNVMPAQMSGTNSFIPLGKIVESVDIVKATDIPMDGNMYYFPKADGSMVYSKQWLANGQTRILSFEPVLEGEGNNSTDSNKNSQIDTFTQFLQGIQEDIKLLNDKVDKLTKPTKAKKEGAGDE